MILVVNTNSNSCRFYKFNKHPVQLILFKEIDHPQNRLKNMDLTSDRPGHYQGGESARGAYSPHMDAKDVEIDNFLRDVARELNQERNEHDYDELILIAPPHVTGILHHHLNKNVKNMISNTIQKDLIFMKDHELIKFLQEELQLPTNNKK